MSSSFCGVDIDGIVKVIFIKWNISNIVLTYKWIGIDIFLTQKYYVLRVKYILLLLNFR